MSDRLRVRFAKLGKVRFTSHRDVARMWERALRRTGLAVASSQGFTPRPLVAFGLALPTGAESVAEYLDVTLADPDGAPETALELGGLAAALSGALPDGLDVLALAGLDGDVDSLQQEVTSCSWDLEVRGVTASELARRVELLLDAPSVSVQRERKGRTFDDDLRPSVRSLAVSPSPEDVALEGRTWLRAELATRPRGVRPRELVEVLGADVVLSKARRTQQWIEHDGIRREPLEVDLAHAVIAPHARGRAS
ncbi:MAG TPA: TIGR03936 family radical SAM-associated protein [Acidimicrobiia bacterium]|nr:TIGR03936 family radical SAM-associated protein [Acidimicrobiia bacterium]